MAEIRVKENESLDSALRRFKRSCAKAGVLSEVRKREHYEKPSVKRKKKSEAARKRTYSTVGSSAHLTVLRGRRGERSSSTISGRLRGSAPCPCE